MAESVNADCPLDNVYRNIYTLGVTRRLHSFYLDRELSAALKVVKQRDGMPEGEQVRRALWDWFKKKKVKLVQVPKEGGLKKNQ